MADFNWNDYPVAAPSKGSTSNFSWDDHKIVKAADTTDTSPVTSATTGLLQGASLGLAPALAAAGKTGLDALTGNTSLDDLVDEYRNQRDALRESFAKAAAAHPVINTAANIAGAIPTLGAIPTPTSLASLAGTGAVSGAANSDADLTKGEVLPALKDAAKGALINTIAGKSISAITQGASDIINPEVMQELADTSAVRSLNPLKSQMKNLQMAGKVTGDNSLGRTLLRTPGAITPFASLADKKAAMEALEETSGSTIGDTIDALDQNGIEAPKPSEISSAIQEQAAPLQNLKTAQPTFNALQDVAGDISTLGDTAPTGTDLPGGFRQLQDIKNFVNDQADKSGAWNYNPSEKAQALGQVSGMVKSKLEDAVEAGANELGDKDLLNKYLQSKIDYGNSTTAKNILNSSLASEAANNKIGLTSTIIGTGELGAGNPVKALGTMGAWQAAKSYGNNFTAVGADQLSSVLRTTPEVFGAFRGVLESAANRGSGALGVTNNLLQQTNEAYRSHMRKIFGDESQ